MSDRCIDDLEVFKVRFNSIQSQSKLFLFGLAILSVAGCAGDKGSGSSLVSGNSNGGFSIRGSNGIGDLADELAKFDAKKDQGVLEPTIIETNVDGTTGDSDIIAVTQLDQQAFGTVRLPDGYECIGQGGFITDTPDIVILSVDHDNCTARITFADSVVDPSGRVFFAGTVKNSDGEEVVLNYEITVSESDNDVSSLTVDDDFGGEFEIPQFQDISINSERLTLGDLNAVGDGNVGLHYFMFSDDIDPTNIVFQYSIDEAFDASSLENVENVSACSVQQNRQYYGEPDHIDELVEENCPFLIEEINYETNKIRFRLKFEPVEGFPDRYELKGLQGISVPRGKALLVLEVKHTGDLPEPATQSITVNQQFRLQVDFLGQPEPDVSGLVRLPARPGAENQYYRTAGRVSAIAGFDLAREVQDQLRDQFGEGVKFYAVRMDDAAENQWVFNQVLNLIWIGSVDIQQEGDWTSRLEIEGGSYANYTPGPLPYTSWLPGEPNNRRGEHCAHMRWHFNSSAWNDWGCNGAGFMIYELELTEEFTNGGDDDGPFDVLR